MPVKVSLNGNLEWFNLIEKEDKYLFLTDESGVEIQVNTPLKLDPTFKDMDFEVHFLAKKM